MKCFIEFEIFKKNRAVGNFVYTLFNLFFWWLFIWVLFPIHSLTELFGLSYLLFFILQEVCYYIDSYNNYVFDFDEPPKNKKEEKVKSLSKLMEQAFQRIKDIVNRPSAIPVPTNYEVS